MTLSSSPSQFLLFAAWNTGWAYWAWTSANPMILPRTPLMVWGAMPMTRCPIRSSGLSAL